MEKRTGIRWTQNTEWKQGKGGLGKQWESEEPLGTMSRLLAPRP